MDAAQGDEYSRLGGGLGVSVSTCGAVGAGAGVVASSRASARPVWLGRWLWRGCGVVARQHGLGGDSGTPSAWAAAAARTCRVVVESRKVRRAQRGERSEAREARRWKRGGWERGVQATGAMPGSRRRWMAKSAVRRFPARAQGWLLVGTRIRVGGGAQDSNLSFSMRANGEVGSDPRVGVVFQRSAVPPRRAQASAFAHAQAGEPGGYNTLSRNSDARW